MKAAKAYLRSPHVVRLGGWFPLEKHCPIVFQKYIHQQRDAWRVGARVGTDPDYNQTDDQLGRQPR
jgi:hypothetical protein